MSPVRGVSPWHAGVLVHLLSEWPCVYGEPRSAGVATPEPRKMQSWKLDEPAPHSTSEFTRPEQFPLKTMGRWVVDNRNRRVKLACINWFGAYLLEHVVLGLDILPIDNISATIRQLGFNCVRLPYSTEGVLRNPRVDATKLTKNPQFLVNGTAPLFLDMLDETIAALARQRIMTIINNHNSASGWCCSAESYEGVWYTDVWAPEGKGWTEEQWIQSLEILAERYKTNPYVIGYELRNEPHDFAGNEKGPPLSLSWGDGNPKTDYAMAMKKCGNRVLKKDPNALVLIEGLGLSAHFRSAMMNDPIELDIPNRRVWAPHAYHFFQFYSLVEVMLMPWSSIRARLLCLASWCMVVMLSLCWVWRSRGSPIPPANLWYMIAGSWTVIAMLCGVLFHWLSWWSMGPVGKSMWEANRESMPGIICYACLTSIGIAIWLWGRYGPNQLQKINSNSESETGTDPVNSMKSMAVAHAMVYKTEGDNGCAVFCGYNCGLGLLGTFIFCCYAISMSFNFKTSWWFALHHDFNWGFVLEEGHPWTGPIFVGEFGAQARGSYWLQLINYMADRDVDWAYWNLNPERPIQGLQMGEYKNKNGWYDYQGDEIRWKNETYGLLLLDWTSIRYPWLLMDLQRLQSSPPHGNVHHRPCSSAAFGLDCGG